MHSTEEVVKEKENFNGSPMAVVALDFDYADVLPLRLHAGWFIGEKCQAFLK